MTTWILVFWLAHANNYTNYEQYKTEIECRDAEQMWNRRFYLVNSKLVAECREQTK